MKKCCKVDGCEGLYQFRGYCQKHYRRFLKYGDPRGGRAFDGAKEKWILDHAGYLGNECLPWPFPNNEDGYGLLKVDGVQIRAHRFMCVTAHGQPPTPDHEAAHSCGESWCRNQNHLRWATPAENNADKLIHGTIVMGERHAFAKLTADQVKIIRDSRGRTTQTILAKRFGVTQQAICLIQKRKNWASLPENEVSNA